MYCKKCGKELKEGEEFCPACGASVNGAVAAPDVIQSANDDSGSLGWLFLGFFIPIVGLILFLVWKSEKPRSAKKAGLGALIGVIVYFVLMLTIIIVSASLANTVIHY